MIHEMLSAKSTRVILTRLWCSNILGLKKTPRIAITWLEHYSRKHAWAKLEHASRLLRLGSEDVRLCSIRSEPKSPNLRPRERLVQILWRVQISFTENPEMILENFRGYCRIWKFSWSSWRIRKISLKRRSSVADLKINGNLSRIWREAVTSPI